MNSHQQDMKKHFKLYKAGKLWLVTALASAGFMVTGHHQVKADTTDQAGTKIVRKLNNTNNGSNDSSQTVSNNETNNTSTTLNNVYVQSATSQNNGNSSNVAQTGVNTSNSNDANNRTNTINSSDSNNVNSTDDSQSSLTNKNVEYTQNGQWYLKDANGNTLNGWQKLNDGRTVYYQTNDNTMVHGEKDIDGDWYHFNEVSGAMSTGFTQLADGRLVYYDPSNGKMVHSPQLTVNNHQYTVNQQIGAVRTGWNNYNDHEYYIHNDGTYASGEEKITGNWYYFNPDQGDVMSTGFTTLPDGREVYYQLDNGHMVHGEKKISGNWYHFDEVTGQVSTGLLKLKDGRTVYYDDEGRMLYGERVVNGNHYFFDYTDGHMITGLFYNKDKQGLQYYDQDGIRHHGEVTIDGKVYNFATREDLLLSDKTGEQSINGNWYFFNDNGSVATGLVALRDGRTVYYSPDTAQMVHGEVKLNGKWHFFDYGDGHEHKNEFAQLHDGRTTYYDNNGNMVYGEKAVNGHWYFFDKSNGKMATGFTWLPDGRVVYYDNLGHMLYSWQKINGVQYYFDRQTGNMARGHVSIDGHNHTFDNLGHLDEWGWPFPNVGEGHFMGSQLFGVNPGGEFRMNGFHDGLDFGSADHPGSEVHAIHSGKVTQIGYAGGLDNYVLVDTGEYLIVYQEAFASRSDIYVHVGQEISTGDVIGQRDTSHVHIGVTRQHNFNIALANSFNNNGTWLNPLDLIRNGQ